jgi:predicted metal-dependent hydrolase
MQLFPEAIRFRKTKRQWGSCSGKNVLSFNTMLMKLPEEVIAYVVVHELAHIAHKHHQRSFWKLVGQHMPDYEAHIAELHTYTT